jgi:hypothetical protein
MLYLVPFFIVIAFCVTFGVIIKVTNYSSGANFTQCYTFIQNIIDPTLFPNTFWSKNVTTKYLSLSGCYTHCGGNGFQFWPVKDTIDRVSLWVVPALILLTHFSFARVDIWNFPAVIIHAVGDPIDSIWGLLSRIEVNRRILHRSTELCCLFRNGSQDSKEDKPKRLLESIKCSLRYYIFDCIAQPISQELFPDPWKQTPTTDAEHIAAVAAAYEECGWQDVLKHVQETLSARSVDKTSNRTKPSQQDPQNCPVVDPAPKICELRDDEMKCIKRASHELSRCRQHSQTYAIIPIVSLAISLASAINRTVHDIEQATTRLANEIAHNIALLSLLFIFLPIVAFSSRLGTFMTISSPVEIIKEMRGKLRMIREGVFREKREMELRAILERECREVDKEESAEIFDNVEGDIRRREMKTAEWAKLSEILDEDVREFRAQQLNPDEKMEKELFPALQYSLLDHERGENHHEQVDEVNWSQRASFSGINPTYRPNKHLLPRDFSKYTQEFPLPSTKIAVKIRRRLARTLQALKVWKSPGMDASESRWKHLWANITNQNRSRRLLWFYSVLFVVGGASVPAIFLSASNHSGQHKVAIGCRTLSWIVITTLWLLSSTLDVVSVPVHRRSKDSYALCVARARWHYTIYKDVCIVIPIVILVTWIQIGFFNSCWCRSSLGGYINLNPYNDEEWYQARVLWGTIAPAFLVFNLGSIAWILLVGGKSKGMLCRSQIQMQRDAMDLGGKQQDDGKVNENTTETDLDEKVEWCNPK